mgnify:FL=1
MKKINYMIILLLGLFCFNQSVFAGSLGVSANRTSITQGDSVTIYVKANGLAGKFTVTSSNSGVLSGGTSGEWIENDTKSYKFISKNTGTAKIIINPVDVADLSNNQKYSGSKSITITVNKPREKSNNNNLKGLSIDNATLTPDFNKDTLEYRVELESSVEKININATKEDGYASVGGAGEKEVAEGENRFEIVVTSETGNKKTYTIIANVVDNNPITQEVDGKKLSLVKRSKSLIKPNDDFVESKVTISDTEIPTFYNEKLNLTLVGLKDADGKIALYIYNQDKNTYSKYQQFQSSNIIIMSKVPTDIPEGYVKTSIKVDDNTYDVYQLAGNKGYSLIYGLNLNTGKTNWYSYHEDEKTIQVYNDKVITELKKDNQEKIDTYKKIVIGLGSLSILLLIIILLLLLKKNKRKSKVSGIDK